MADGKWTPTLSMSVSPRSTLSPASALTPPAWGDPLPTEAQVRQLSELCREFDGCRNLDDSLLWAYLDGRAEGLWDPDGRAHLGLEAHPDGGRLQLLVHPDWRGQTTGSLWLRHGLQRLRQLGCHRVHLWAYGDRRATVAWLTRLGFSHQRLLYRLVRPAGATAAPDWPTGWSVRSFQPECDEAAWHALHLRMQSDPSRAWSLAALRRQLDDPATPPESFRLLWQGETLRGYVWLKLDELFMFAVDPEARGHGIGQKLLAWALSVGDGSALVFCDDQRVAALSLYRKFGFLEQGRDRCLQIRL